jgi:hypothetical protein
MASDNETPAPGSARRAWQGQEPDGGDDARRSGFRFRLMLVVGALSGLGTMLVVLILYLGHRPPSPNFLAINVAEHNHKHFPIQAFARADSELLIRHFDVEKTKRAVTESKELLRKELNALKDRSAPSLVIHVTALALVRDETVYVLPADAEPDNVASWLDVREIVEAVEKCPAAHKLLILDLAHGLIDPQLGVLTDRVAETLEATIRKEKPSFPVLCPCSAGQSSLTSEVLGCSVLAFYLDQGMSGDADTGKNGSVSVLELFEFVRPRVERWARNNRGLRQEPQLLGKQDDFVLIPPGRPPLEKIEPKALKAYPEALQDAWKKRDEALDSGTFGQAPRQLLRLEANLLRHESRWQAGVADKELLDQETRDLIRELGQLKRAAPPYSFSLVNAKENPPLADAVYSVLRRETDGKKALEEIKKMVKVDADYAQKARLVVDAISQFSELKPAQLKAAQVVLAGLEGKEPRQAFVETMYLDRLAAFAEREYPETFQMARPESIWRTMRAREEAVGALEREPEFLPWVAATMVAADRKRRGAEGKLLWERPPAWPEALQELKSSQATYGEVKKTLEAMQIGRTALDRALAELPAHLRILGDGPDADSQAELIWLKAAEEAAYLHRFFVDHRDATDAKVDTHGHELRQQLDELMRLFRKRITNAEKADTAKAQRQLRVLLQGSLLRAPARADLSNKLSKAAKKLHDETEADFQPGANAVERTTAFARGQMSRALLHLAGMDTDGQDFAWPAPKEPGSLSVWEKTLHGSWGKNGIVKHWREAPHDRRGDVLSRLVSPWYPYTNDEDHGRLWQTKLRDDQLNWLQQQFESESREAGPRARKTDDPRDQALRDFYRDAARKLAVQRADAE